MNDVMVDIETLGTAPGSVVVSIGAVRFGDDGLGAEFYRVVDVLDSLLAGLRVDEATVGWWRTQPPGAKAALSAKDARRTLAEALYDFGRFLDGSDAARVWAKGPDFDLVLLQAAHVAVGVLLPWKYRNARDVRTILALSSEGHQVKRVGDEHHALTDARYQAEQVRAVYRALGLRLDGTAQARSASSATPDNDRADATSVPRPLVGEPA